MKQCQDIKQNWRGRENFDTRFCVIFDQWYQSLISGRKIRHKVLSPTIFEIFAIFTKILMLKSFDNS